jgi:hypothetical protein
MLRLGCASVRLLLPQKKEATPTKRKIVNGHREAAAAAAATAAPAIYARSGFRTRTNDFSRSCRLGDWPRSKVLRHNSGRREEKEFLAQKYQA